MNRLKAHSAHASLFGTGKLVSPYRCAVIVAHPCDELFGAGGLMARLRDVRILHVTTGGSNLKDALASSPGKQPAEKLPINECAQALSLLNIPRDHIIEFGLSNTAKAQLLVNLTRKIAAFLQRYATDILLTHPYEGGHPDHDATAFATHAAMRLLKRNGFNPPTLFEMAVRPSRDGSTRVLDFLPGSWREATTWVLDEKAKSLKKRMLDCLSVDKDALKTTSLKAERFRRPPEYDFSRPSLAGKAHYENFMSEITGDEWASLARRAWADLFPA